MRVKIRGEVKEIKEGERLISILSEPDIIAARVNGKLVDLSYQPQEGDVIEPITFDDDDGKQIYWPLLHILWHRQLRSYSLTQSSQ